jgi:retron-type reverse transcriptase
MYIERWLTAPFETAQGTRLPRDRGTPQGGVVSPILMNLFMHYCYVPLYSDFRGAVCLSIK